MEAVEGEIVDATAKVKGFGVRHGQVLLQFFFYIVLFGIELSLTVTIAAIIDSPGGDRKIFPEHNMSQIASALQGYMIGFLITILFGGWICKKFGFKRPMIIMMVIISALSLFLPFIFTELGFPGLMFCRVTQGLCAGIIFPMPADFINKWIPVNERTTLGTAVYASSILGDLLVLFVSPLIVSSRLGWTFIFEGYGFLAIIWAILMAIYGADSPEKYQHEISEAEVKHILQNRGNARSKTKVKIPWIKLLTSTPVWATIIGQIGSSWLLFVLSTNIPMLMEYNFNLRMMVTIPVFIGLITWLLSFAMSALAELLIIEGRTSISQSRKIFNSIGTLVPGVFFLLLLLVTGGSQYLGVGVWTIISVASVGTILGSKLNQNDISSNFSPIIYGMATFAGTLFNILFVIVFSGDMIDNWKILFAATTIVLVLTNCFFLKFGSGEEQEWDTYEDIEEEEFGFSKSSTYISCDEGKYLLFIRKQ